MNNEMKCKCKSCGEEAQSIYIPRTLIGEYCIKTECQEEGWQEHRYEVMQCRLYDLLLDTNMSVEGKVKHILKITGWK